ncbi:PQQ-binding-like beta-propeller repeat protein [Streptomyces sp. PRKS01-29]|nr:PQQ-binding-like beta-propeller repeat protein [Streptomyces sabulosicollis]MBI0300764.1 PQQ-binding-like beta-propeller repeat protein [Streptomyces sabulosicollis]
MDVRTGRTLWSRRVGRGLSCGPNVVAGRWNAPYLATAAGRLVALDRRGGRVLWRTKARTDAGGVPAELTLNGGALTTVYGYDSLEAAGRDICRGG